MGEALLDVKAHHILSIITSGRCHGRKQGTSDPGGHRHHAGPGHRLRLLCTCGS